MKHIKSRIAAASCAAITAICGMQALSASAYNTNYPYTRNTQNFCQEPRNMSYNLHAWQSYGYPQGKKFSQTVDGGVLVGKGFTEAHISSYNNYNAQMTGPRAWVRFLANSHFGTVVEGRGVWMELPSADFTGTGSFALGDQIILNGSNALFVTGINSDNTIYCSELISGKVAWSTQYKLTKSGNQPMQLQRIAGGSKTTYTLNYVVRPVKEGDANGDGWVNLNDVIWTEGHYNCYNFPDENYNVQMAAADVNGNGQIDNGDRDIIYGHYYGGVMNGNYRYVLWYKIPEDDMN